MHKHLGLGTLDMQGHCLVWGERRMFGVLSEFYKSTCDGHVEALYANGVSYEISATAPSTRPLGDVLKGLGH